jgi:metabolite-proton symporter
MRISAAAGPSVSLRRIIVACCIGSTIEWFDFFAYAIAAALVFPALFFPSLSPLSGSLAAFATLGVGFLARPVGGMLMGHYGDRLGRKSMLVLSLLGMGIATVGIGVLPTYAQIGVFAPILLVLLRCVQGLAIGGEWGGAVLIAVEHAPANRRGLYGSFVQMGIPAGVILSNLVILLVSTGLTGEQFRSWGWRIPFLLSLVLVIVGFVVRAGVTESPLFRQAVATSQVSRAPVVEVLRTARRQVLLAAGTFIAPNAMGYMVTTYSLSYATTFLHVPRATMITMILSAAVVWLAAAGCFAALSDSLGRRRVLVASLIGLVLWSLVFFPLLQTGSTPLMYLALAVLAGLCGAANGPQAALFSEMFRTNVRYSGISLSYQIGSILGGGIAPFLATALYALTMTSVPITVYLVLMSALSLCCALLVVEASRHKLSG